jgi:hypothetical protein
MNIYLSLGYISPKKFAKWIANECPVYRGKFKSSFFLGDTIQVEPDSLVYEKIRVSVNLVQWKRQEKK